VHVRPREIDSHALATAASGGQQRAMKYHLKKRPRAAGRLLGMGGMVAHGRVVGEEAIEGALVPILGAEP
jgi:hypothetical protein